MILREILGVIGMVAGLIAMIIGLFLAGEAAIWIIGGMVFGTASTLLVIHAGPLDEPDQDPFNERVNEPN